MSDRRSVPVERHLRNRVHAYLQRTALASGASLSILDLGCGFGNDALWLASLGHQVLAVDDDTTRLAAAMEHARNTETGTKLQFAELDISCCSPELFSSQFDLLLCNLGVLNRIDLNAVRRLGLASTNWVRPGGRAVMVTMSRGPARGNSSLLHNPQRLVDAFAPAFSLVRLCALSIVTPHPHQTSASWIRGPGVHALGAIDRILGAVPGSHHIARTVVLDLKKSGTKTVTSSWKQQVWQGNAPAPAASFQGTNANRTSVDVRPQSAPSAIDR